jgi:hypothetical protein
VGRQLGQRWLAEPGRREPEAPGDGGQTLPRQQRQVRAARPQRRQLQVDHGDAVVQVGAEAPPAHLAGQVAAGGRDDPGVQRQRPAAPHPLEAALLEHAQQAGLLRRLELADLVEKERTAGRALQPPDATRRRAGEGAPLVTEELALQQRRREGGAVDVDELASPCRVAMQHAGTQALADAGLAGDQHRGVERSEAQQLRPDAPDGLALAGQSLAVRRHPVSQARARRHRKAASAQDSAGRGLRGVGRWRIACASGARTAGAVARCAPSCARPHYS